MYIRSKIFGDFYKTKKGLELFFFLLKLMFNGGLAKIENDFSKVFLVNLYKVNYVWYKFGRNRQWSLGALADN